MAGRLVTTDDDAIRRSLQQANTLPWFTINSGSATLVGGTKAVTITGIKLDAKAILQRKSVGGTAGHLTYAVTANTLTINSSSGTDTSVVEYYVIDAN